MAGYTSTCHTRPIHLLELAPMQKIFYSFHFQLMHFLLYIATGNTKKKIFYLKALELGMFAKITPMFKYLPFTQ